MLLTESKAFSLALVQVFISLAVLLIHYKEKVLSFFTVRKIQAHLALICLECVEEGLDIVVGELVKELLLP